MPPGLVSEIVVPWKSVDGQLVVAGLADHVLVRRPEGGEVHRLGALDARHEQLAGAVGLLHVDGEAEVDVRGGDQVGLAVDDLEPDVHLRHRAQRLDQGVADEVGERDLAAAGAGEVVVDDGAVVPQQLHRDRAHRRGGRHRQGGVHVGRGAGGCSAQDGVGRGVARLRRGGGRGVLRDRGAGALGGLVGGGRGTGGGLRGRLLRGLLGRLLDRLLSGLLGRRRCGCCRLLGSLGGGLRGSRGGHLGRGLGRGLRGGRSGLRRWRGLPVAEVRRPLRTHARGVLVVLLLHLVHEPLVGSQVG